MARAKHIQRAEARRRHREQSRANQLAAGVADPNSIGPDNEDAAPRPQPTTARGSMFSRPDLRGDIAALPEIFRTKRLIWIPFILTVAGFLIVLMFANSDPAGTGYTLATLSYTLILSPTALFVPFIGGFLAPRGSYLIGALIGLMDAVFDTILWALLGNSSVTSGSSTSAVGVSQVVVMFFLSIVVAALAAAFAAWYRNFLRTSQERARQNRIARDEMAAAKAREQERKQRIADREARRTAASRNTTP